MAAARSAFRLTTRFAPRVAIRSQAARPFSVSARAFKSDVVSEKEVPVSVYAPDAKGTGQSDHFSIPVREHDSRPPTESPVPGPENDDVVPLTRKTFDSMPPMMQKLSVMGKTIVVTGYVFSPSIVINCGITAPIDYSALPSKLKAVKQHHD